MKYLVVEVRQNGYHRLCTYPILEDAQKAYEIAKKDKDNNHGVYLTAILKEIDL